MQKRSFVIQFCFQFKVVYCWKKFLVDLHTWKGMLKNSILLTHFIYFSNFWHFKSETQFSFLVLVEQRVNCFWTIHKFFKWISICIKTVPYMGTPFIISNDVMEYWIWVKKTKVNKQKFVSEKNYLIQFTSSWIDFPIHWP